MVMKQQFYNWNSFKENLMQLESLFQVMPKGNVLIEAMSPIGWPLETGMGLVNAF